MAAIYVPQYFNDPDHLNIEHLNKGVQKVRILKAQYSDPHFTWVSA